MFEGTNEKVLYACLIGITGSFAIFASAAWDLGNVGMIAAAICAAMFTLFISVVVNLASEKVIVAVRESKLREENIQIVEVAAKAAAQAAYSGISELRKKD